MKKSKKVLPFFYVLVPLFFVGLVQNNILSKSDTNENTIQQQGDKVVYRIKNNQYTKLNKKYQNDEVNKIKHQMQAVVFLNKYLSLAKKESNSAYAGFAISGYHLLPKGIKASAAVKQIYAELLSYSHDFDSALTNYEDLQQISEYKQQATMKLMNVYMLKGDHEQVEKQCKLTRTFSDYKISIVCRLWLKGFSSDVDDSVNALNQLLSIYSSLSHSSQQQSFNLWLLQLILDLQLKNDDVQAALITIERLYKTSKVDLSALIQIVDYLVINNRFELAQALILKHDSRDELIIRAAIINEISLNKNGVQLIKNSPNKSELMIAKLKVENYVFINEKSKFVEIVLWYWLVESDLDKAVFFAKENSLNYSTFNNELLLKRLELDRLAQAAGQ